MGIDKEKYQSKEYNDQLTETQKVLSDAYDWMQNWFKNFRQNTGLSKDVIEGKFKLQDKDWLPEIITIETEKGKCPYQISNFDYQIKSDFGPVTRVQLVQSRSHSVPAGVPMGMSVLTEVGDFEKAKYISTGWRFGESDIIFFNFGCKNQKIIRVTQVTKPGILFDGPFEMSREYNQMFLANFEYSDNQLLGWNVSVSDEERGRDVSVTIFSNGDRLLIGPRRHEYRMPEKINVAKAIRNIIEIKPAIESSR
jgi:hypothetical protein